MHRPTPLSRSFAALIAPLAVLGTLAGIAMAEDASISDRLAELNKSWSGDKAEPQVPTKPRAPSRDLFDALGSVRPRGAAPRVASRQMLRHDEMPAPMQARAGSVLSHVPAGGGFDIGTALGGPMPAEERLDPIATITNNGPQPTPVGEPTLASPAPARVAANPVSARRNRSRDVALDLISSTASSRDTSGLARKPAATMDIPTELFPTDTALVSDDPFDKRAAADVDFATAADAAATAQLPTAAGNVTIPPTPAEPVSPSSEVSDKALVEVEPNPAPLAVATDEWDMAGANDGPTADVADATSSVTAERAFSRPDPSQESPAYNPASNEVWIATPTTGASAFDRSAAAAGKQVLMSEQLPLITSNVTGPKTILIGREAKYQVTIENRGSATAEQLSTEVIAPEWADVVHAMASSGAVQRPPSATGGTVLRWDIASLAAGRSQTLDLVVVPKTSQPLSLGVSWRHAPVASTTMVEVQEPKLAMALSGPDEVFFGRPQTYRLSLSNPGTGLAENVVVQLMPPGGGQAVSSYRLEKLAAGESKVVDIEITAREPGELAINAVAVADGNLRCEAEQAIFCRQAELNVDWRGPARKYAGTEAVYYFRVRNPGTASAEQVEFDVTLPAGFEFRGASDGHQADQTAGRVVWKIGTLRPGDDCYLELRGIVNQAGENHMRLSAANSGGDVHDTKSATTDVVALADLKLDVSDPKGPVPVGTEVYYEITVTNRGRSTAEEVSVIGMFSNGIEPVGAEGAEATIADGRVGFRTIGAVPAGQQVKLKIRARALSAGTHLFRAEVLCRDLEIKLAAEETTRFFQDESTAAANGAPVEAASRASRFE